MISSHVTVTGPSSAFGANGNSCAVFNGAGSRLRPSAKLIESGTANARLAVKRRAPPSSVVPRPKEDAAYRQPALRGHHLHSVHPSSGPIGHGSLSGDPEFGSRHRPTNAGQGGHGQKHP